MMIRPSVRESALLRVAALLAIIGVSAGLPACHQGDSSPGPRAIRIVDLYEPGMVMGKPMATVPLPPRTEWIFDRPQQDAGDAREGAFGWTAARGIAGLTIWEGALIGRTDSDFPVLHYERATGLDDQDLLHEIRVRLRVSGGADMSITFEDSEKVDITRKINAGRVVPWRISSPIIPGDDFRTYTLKSRRAVRGADIRHILLRPTDAKGVTFEIESFRLVFRNEHLAAVPSGVSWQGLDGVYRETIVTRSPETIRIDLDIPEDPLLDLAVGTIVSNPVTFRVTARGAGDAPAEKLLLERTVTTPHRWEPATIDLSPFAGKRMTLTFSVVSDLPGRPGFWGTPVVRSRATMNVARTDGLERVPRGVVLIMTDTLRRDHLEVYGYDRETGPEIQSMADEGTLFTDCLSQGTWTKVAAPSLVTSLYPTTHGVKEFTHRLPSSAVTIAEIYRDAGYATIGFSSNLFTTQFSNMHQGFEVLHEDDSLVNPNSTKTSREFMDRALAWIESHRDVPFFIFMHLYDPHDPYRPDPPWDKLWTDPSHREEHERRAKKVRKLIADPLLRNFGMPNREDLLEADIDPDSFIDYEVALYDGSIRGMDAEIGRLLERLRAPGLSGKTVVAFTSDHGEEFLDHGEMFHGHSVHAELTDVPLILWGPGTVASGIVVNETVELIDVMPTLLALSGLQMPDGVQGRSLVPLLSPHLSQRRAAVRGGVVGRPVQAKESGWIARPAVVEKPAIEDRAGPANRETNVYAIVTGKWKLIRSTAASGSRSNGAGPDAAGPDVAGPDTVIPAFELYDRRQDPLERNDVAAEHREVVERLARELDAWLARAEAERLVGDSEMMQEMNQEQLERLRSLGYIN